MALIAVFGIVPSVSAVVRTDARIEYLTDFASYSVWTPDYDVDQYQYGDPEVTSEIIGYQRDYSVLDSQNNPTVTSFTGTVISYANYSSLSTHAQTTVVNPVPLGSNQPYKDEAGNLIEGGMPSGFSSNSSASMYDSIQMSLPNIANIKFKLGLNGAISGIDGVDQGPQSGAFQIYMQATQSNGEIVRSQISHDYYGGVFDFSDWTLRYPTKFFDKEYFSSLIPTVNGTAQFSFELNTEAATVFSAMTSSGPGFFASEGETYEVTSDLTLSILGIYAYDGNGNLLNSSLLSAGINELKGKSGASYSLLAAPVPDPESYVLMLSGLGFLGSMMRRRQASLAE
ncbi:PEP-CTERM sorting domain-containing protein [Methylomonas koyamae]|uniref:PEP-CTERM sorting domain-containing protein n=1 Tax=Methylomonas koyamae TaxID=702114 RepID=UPI0012F63B22|nr:PEP-CTERM sorting domain-containing protein [Methylomonas koyamae]